MTALDLMELGMELPVVDTLEALVFVAKVLPVLVEKLLLVELVRLPPPDLAGLLSNVSSSPITPPSPRTYDHLRAVALTTVSLLNPKCV